MLTAAIIIAACATPAWFASRMARHHVRQLRAVRAWERHLNS